MSKRGDKPRRLMTKVRRQVGKPTMEETPKNIYDRNIWKRETERTLTEEFLKRELTKEVVLCCIHPPGDGSTCAGGNCMCEEDYICDKCEVNDGN